MPFVNNTISSMAQSAHIFLVNNKDKEPDFAKAFTKIARQKHAKIDHVSVFDCAYAYLRTDNSVSIYCKNKLIPTEGTSWFIRRWGPSEETTALLSLILETRHIPFHDNKINSLHEVRTSKLSHAFQLAAAGIKSPSTWVVPLVSYALYKKRVIKSLHFPLVVKARGGLGQRVWLCKNEVELDQKIANLITEGKDAMVIFQECITNNGDIRIVVYKNKVLASILRQSSDGFLNNVSQGGTATPISITKQEEKIAIRAAKTIGLDLAGVDLVRHESSPLIFEVNKAPDITSFHAAAGFNIAEKIAEAFITLPVQKKR